MRTRRIIAATVAAGVVGAGVVATPMVLAADSGGTGSGSTDDGAPGRGWGMHERGEGWSEGRPGHGEGFGMHRGTGPGEGFGMHRGTGPGMHRGMGQGQGPHTRGDGDCLLDGDGSVSGTLDEADEQALLEQVEHEKVARDVYVAFFDATGDYRFERVAQSEQRHLEALRWLLDRYDLTDPTAGRDEGEFASRAFQDQYDAYVAQGDDLAGALAAARQIESEDIADLAAAAKALDDAPDVEHVYERQVKASEHHLAAFSR